MDIDEMSPGEEDEAALKVLRGRNADGEAMIKSLDLRLTRM
jgi:hypothetical protein